LVVVDIILCGFAIFGFADWFFGSGERERAQIAQLTIAPTDFAFFRQKNTPKQVTLDRAAVLNAGDKTYDYFAKAANPNTAWWVEFDYRFRAPSRRRRSGDTSCRRRNTQRARREIDVRLASNYRRGRRGTR
jgi:hypothetical protein